MTYWTYRPPADTVRSVFHLLHRPVGDIVVSVHPAHNFALLDPAESARLRALGLEHHASVLPPRWCDPSLAPVTWRADNDGMRVEACVTHWCAAVPARTWWAEASESTRQSIGGHAAAGLLDPVLSPRTSMNVLVSTVDGHHVGMRRSETVTDPGAFDIPSEVLDHNDLRATAHGWTASYLDVARRAVAEETGITDISSVTISAWAWNDAIATVLAFADLRTPMTFREVVDAWEGADGRSESSSLLSLPDTMVNPKVDFARRVAR